VVAIQKESDFYILFGSGYAGLGTLNARLGHSCFTKLADAAEREALAKQLKEQPNRVTVRVSQCASHKGPFVRI
jgi:hypothetical protein